MARFRAAPYTGERDESTREEKLEQVRRILAENVERSARLQEVLWHRDEGRGVPPAVEKELVALRELRCYAVKRDNLSIQYEKDHAACAQKHAEERDTLEANARLKERGGVYGPGKLKAEWKRCPLVQAKKQERSKAREAARKTTRRGGANHVAQKARAALSGLRACVTTNRSLWQEGRGQGGAPVDDSGPLLECGLCFECHRQSLRLGQENELLDLYEAYCERAYEIFEETTAKIGEGHLTWWPPSDKPLPPDPRTSTTISVTDPIMVSSRALDSQRCYITVLGGDNGYNPEGQCFNTVRDWELNDTDSTQESYHT